MVRRDRRGVPHITARTTRDAYYALGYVHAQDRLWQMELNRRLGAGRLAEAFGAAALPSDRFMRTLNFHALAAGQLQHLDAGVVEALDAYADGVNAWIDGHRDPWQLPPEFQALALRPEAWQPADSLVWLRLMAMHLSGNWRDELLRARLAKTLTPEQLADLWPGCRPTAPRPCPGCGRARTGWPWATCPTPPARPPTCRAASQMPGPCPGRARATATRCWPTTRTWATGRRSCGTWPRSRRRA
ncbi:MAG: penicillin acylase family protein [Hyphomicrobiales bacterium]|nr:penicillin acylase family protein [Hyphomicrobiales bacterium]